MLRTCMGLENSPQLNMSTQCKPNHTRRHGWASAGHAGAKSTRTQAGGTVEVREHRCRACAHMVGSAGNGSEHVSAVVAVPCVGCCSFLESNDLHKAQDTEGRLLQTRARYAHTHARMLTRPPQTHHPRSRCHVSCAAFVSVLARCDPLAALGRRTSHRKCTQPRKRTHEHNLCVRTNCRH